MVLRVPGARRSGANANHMKNPALATVLNVLFPGAGYVYLGKRAIFGKIMLSGTILCFIGVVLSAIYNPLPEITFHLVDLVSLAGGIITLIAFGYDANQLAKEQ